MIPQWNIRTFKTEMALLSAASLMNWAVSELR